MTVFSTIAMINVHMLHTSEMSLFPVKIGAINYDWVTEYRNRGPKDFGRRGNDI